MESTEQKESKNIFLTIYKGIPKPVVYSLITAIIIGAVSFSYAFVSQTGATNKDLPKEKEKVEAIGAKVERLAIDSEIMKVDVANIKESQKDMADEQKAQRDLLVQLLLVTNRINNNTRNDNN